MSQHEVACRHELGLGEQEEEVGGGVAVEIALGLPARQFLIVGKAQLVGAENFFSIFKRGVIGTITT